MNFYFHSFVGAGMTHVAVAGMKAGEFFFHSCVGDAGMKHSGLDAGMKAAESSNPERKSRHHIYHAGCGLQLQVMVMQAALDLSLSA